MDHATRYTTSRYLRIVREQGDRDFTRSGGTLSTTAGEHTFAYHSLLGHGRVVNRDTVDILRRCERGVTLDDLTKTLAREDVEELFRLSYLTEEGADERDMITDILQHRRGRLPSGDLLTSLQLVMTNSCNFKCEYCFAYNFDGAVTARNEGGEVVKPGPALAHSQPGRRASLRVLGKDEPPAERRPADALDWNEDRAAPLRNPRGHMSAATAELAIERAIATRARAGGDTLGIAFFGGEPTLNRDVILHVLRRFRNGEGTGVRLEFELTTNGSRLDPELVEALARYRVHTTVSVDYICEATGTYRGGVASDVPWATVRDNIDALVRAGVPLKITSVLSEETWDRWGHRLIDYAASIGLAELDVIVSFQPAFFAKHAPITVAERLLQAFDHGQRAGVLLTGYWYHTYLLLVDDEKRRAQADYKTCPAIGRMLSIEPNGSAFACKVTNKKLGDISDWNGIFASDAYAEYAMRAYSNGPECRGCELEGSCSGGSAGALEEQHGDISKMNRGYCTYIRAVVNGLLERHLAHSTAPRDARA
jgi:uncharacterized protein